MSDTPRTDAETGWPFGPKGKIKTKAFYQEKGGAYVLADVARNLEMELKCMEDSLRSSGLTAARAARLGREVRLLRPARRSRREGVPALRGADTLISPVPVPGNAPVPFVDTVAGRRS